MTLIWEEEINGLLMTSATAGFPPGARGRGAGVNSSLLHRPSKRCYLLGIGGRGVGRHKKQEGLCPPRDSNMGRDKIIQDQTNIGAM